MLRDLPQETPGKSQPRRAVFGRDVLRNYELQDSDASKRHMAIWSRGDGSGSQVFLKDLGSKNGTHVDGYRLLVRKEERTGSEPDDDDLRFRAELRDGAVICCGNTVMVFREQLRPPYAPEPPCFEHQGEKMVGPFGLRGLRRDVEQVGAVNAKNPLLGRLNVLLEARTGAGKELLARYVARALGRTKPFVAVNAPAIVPTLFTSEFFGIGKGVASQVAESEGLVGQAQGGCLFIDEIHELPRSAQAQLLRFLQDRDYLRVGEFRERNASVLVMAATSLPIEARAERDIFARLGQYKLTLPPLAERSEDILEIARELLRRRGLPEDEVSRLPLEVELVEALLLHDWPGNIRELRNVLDGVLRKTEGTSTPGLRFWALSGLISPPSAEARRSLTLERVRAVMAATKQNQSQAAKELQIDRSKLQRWLKE